MHKYYRKQERLCMLRFWTFNCCSDCVYQNSLLHMYLHVWIIMNTSRQIQWKRLNFYLFDELSVFHQHMLVLDFCWLDPCFDLVTLSLETNKNINTCSHYTAAVPYHIFKVYIYSPEIPRRSTKFTLITPRYWNWLFHSLLPEENAVYFLQL